MKQPDQTACRKLRTNPFLSVLALLFISGCSAKAESPRSGSVSPEISVTPLLGGIGGLAVQISDPETGLVSIYHAPLDSRDSVSGGAERPLKLMLQFNVADAGQETLNAKLGAPIPAPGSSEARADQNGSTSQEHASQREAYLENNTASTPAMQSHDQDNPPTSAQAEPPAASAREGKDIADEVTAQFAAEFSELDEETAERFDSFYRFDPSEVDVNDSYIEDVRFVESTEYHLEASVMLHNRTEEHWSPRVVLSVVNKYGITLAQGRIFWLFTSIAPDERRQESLKFSRIKQSDVFELLNRSEPESFHEPFALVIHYAD